jgi:hypothetical protein
LVSESIFFNSRKSLLSVLATFATNLRSERRELNVIISQSYPESFHGNTQAGQASPFFIFKTQMIFSILVFASFIISLIATPIRHSLSNTLQLKSSTHPQPQLEKRGGSVSSRSSSCSSLDEFASPPDAPVLKTATIEEDRKPEEKRKRVISDEQRLKNNKAKREIGDEQRLWNNRAKRDLRARKRKEIEANPTALKSWRLKIKQASVRKRIKQQALFDANPAAKIAWRLKERKRGADYRLKKKNMDAKIVADIPKIVWGRKSMNLVEEEDDNEEEGKFIEKKTIEEVGSGDDIESIETIDWYRKI